MQSVKRRSWRKKPGKTSGTWAVWGLIAFLALSAGYGSRDRDNRAQDAKRAMFQKQRFLVFNPMLERRIECTDEILEGKLLKVTGKDKGDMFLSDLWDCRKLSLQRVIYKYPDVAYASGKPIRDISCLRGLRNLRSLNLDENLISDIRPLSSLIHLKYLWLAHNPIQDLSPLKSLTQLYHLNLNAAHVGDADLELLSGLKNLGMLELDRNGIESLEALRGMNVSRLTLNQNQISDISPLTDLGRSLCWLELDENQLTDIGPLAECGRLWELSLRHNRITDIGPLKNLDRVSYLWLSDNAIATLPDLSGMTALVQLDLSDNHITTEEWKKARLPEGIFEVYLSGNPITDFEPAPGNPDFNIVFNGNTYNTGIFKNRKGGNETEDGG